MKWRSGTGGPDLHTDKYILFDVRSMGRGRIFTYVHGWLIVIPYMDPMSHYVYSIFGSVILYDIIF